MLARVHGVYRQWQGRSTTAMEELESYHGLGSFMAGLACLAVAYIVMPRLRRGLSRLLFLLLLIPIFASVPFATRCHHLRAVLSFSFLWICPSKLLLLCWDVSIDYAHSGFLYFATTMMLPIRVKGKEPLSTDRKQGAIFIPLLQFLAFVALLNVYPYRENLSIWVIYILYCMQVYLGLEVLLGRLAKFANIVLGVETYPSFNHPFMASSLSEFWGKRWNLVATTMLRSTVYDPILRCLSRPEQREALALTAHTKTLRETLVLASHTETSCESLTLTSRKPLIQAQSAEKNLALPSGKTLMSGKSPKKTLTPGATQENPTPTHGKTQQGSRNLSSRDEAKCEPNITRKPPLVARALAMLASFFVSGLIHELIFCCINQSHATWEVTAFFILHGFATVLELLLRRNISPFLRLPQPVCIAFTLGFVYITAAWLFMPPVTRAGSDLRIIAEYHHLQSAVLDLFRRR